MQVTSLETAACRLAAALQAAGRRVVFAESCTGGLASSLMSEIPGVSESFCGSAVVYRNATKEAWLGVDGEWLSDPEIGPVSRQVAEAMAIGVLRSTPEADLAASITGHLGPQAPVALGGVVHISVAERDKADGGEDRVIAARRICLQAEDDDPVKLRGLRRSEAAGWLIEAVLHVLQAE